MEDLQSKYRVICKALSHFANAISLQEGIKELIKEKRREKRENKINEHRDIKSASALDRFQPSKR